jgi:hypothetical protein
LESFPRSRGSHEWGAEWTLVSLQVDSRKKSFLIAHTTPNQSPSIFFLPPSNPSHPGAPILKSNPRRNSALAPPIELRAGAAPICRREGLDTDAERRSEELKAAGFNGRPGSKKPRSTVLIQHNHTTPHQTSRPNPTQPDPGAVRTDRAPPPFPLERIPPASEGSGIREICWRRWTRASAGARKATEGCEQGKKQEERSRQGYTECPMIQLSSIGMEFLEIQSPAGRTDGTGPAGRQPTNASVQLPCRCVQCDPPSFLRSLVLFGDERRERKRPLFPSLSARAGGG